MTFRLLSTRPIQIIHPLFKEYQDIRLADDDMRGIFINPDGLLYETTLAGCTCRGYQVHEHCKHFTFLWNRYPCACSQPMQYHAIEDDYRCDLCGRRATGEAVRAHRAQARSRMAS